MADEEFPQEKTELEVAFPDLDEMLDGLGEIRDAEIAGADSGEQASPVGDEESAPVVADGGEESQPAPAPVPPGYIEFEGQQLPVEQVRALLALDQRMRAEPEVAERVGAALKAPAEPTALPEWIDPEDTTTVRLYTEQQRLESELKAVHAQNAQTNERDQRARVVDAFKGAIGQFKAAYPNLSDDQVAQVADAMGRANIVDGLERSEGSLTQGFVRGMEMTLWGTPQLRSLALAEGGSTVSSKSQERKSKTSALSPSGGSAPRSSEKKATPKTREELMSTMLNAVREDPSLTG